VNESQFSSQCHSLRLLVGLHNRSGSCWCTTYCHWLGVSLGIAIRELHTQCKCLVPRHHPFPTLQRFFFVANNGFATAARGQTCIVLTFMTNGYCQPRGSGKSALVVVGFLPPPCKAFLVLSHGARESPTMHIVCEQSLGLIATGHGAAHSQILLLPFTIHPCLCSDPARSLSFLCDSLPAFTKKPMKLLGGRTLRANHCTACVR